MNNNTTPSFFGLQIKQLIDFAKNPDNNYSDQSFAGKLKSFGTLFLLNLVVVGVIMGLLSAIEPFLPKELMEDHKVSEMFDEGNIWVMLLMAAVSAPIGEELIFRFPLKFKVWVIHTLLCVIFIFTGVKLAFAHNTVVQIAGGVILLPLLILYLVKIKRVAPFYAQVWKNKFGVVFYTFTAIFALIHIGNYPLIWATLIAMPVLILPQFTIGIFLGYIRVRFGILWSIAFHAIHNGLFVLLATIAMTVVFKPVEIKTTDYSLNINKSKSDKYGDTVIMMHGDSAKIINHRFKDVLSILLNKDKKFIIVDEDKEGVRLDVKLTRIKKAKDSVNIEKLNGYIILNEMKKAYGFTFDTLHKKVTNYEMYVKDINKLKKYISKKKGNALTQKNSERILKENCSIDEVVVELNNDHEDVEFSNAINTTDFYTLEYPTLSLEKTLIYFDKHLGFGFKKSEKEVEVIKVIFEENNI